MFSGKKVMHSQTGSPAQKMTGRAAFGPGSVRMPAAQPPARLNPPKGHTCKVCPGSGRMR